MNEEFRRRRRQELGDDGPPARLEDGMGCLFSVYWLVNTFILCLTFTASSFALREITHSSRRYADLGLLLGPLFFMAFFFVSALAALLGYDQARRILVIAFGLIGLFFTGLLTFQDGPSGLIPLLVFGIPFLILYISKPLTRDIPELQRWQRIGAMLALIASVLVAAIVRHGI